MATTLVQSDLSTSPDFARGSWLFTWAALANGEQGAQAKGLSSHADKSVQVSGTFGAGGSVQLEGSNDAVTWTILRDPQGTTLIFTAAGLKQILEVVRYIRPNVTAGDGTTSLAVLVVAAGGSDPK